jgi:hypothetical protein
MNEDNKNKEMITYACTQDTKILKESNNDKKIIDGIIVDFSVYKMALELYFVTKNILLMRWFRIVFYLVLLLQIHL